MQHLNRIILTLPPLLSILIQKNEGQHLVYYPYGNIFDYLKLFYNNLDVVNQETL